MPIEASLHVHSQVSLYICLSGGNIWNIMFPFMSNEKKNISFNNGLNTFILFKFINLVNLYIVSIPCSSKGY